MASTTIATHSSNHIDNDHGRASYKTFRPQGQSPPRILDHTPSSYRTATRPANRAEIYSLALGTCFLALLMGWLLYVGIRTAVSTSANKPRKAVRETDPESGSDTWEGRQTPDGNRSLLASLRRASGGELMESARRKSIDIANGLKRDMGSLRRLSHPTRRMDKEAALEAAEGGVEEGRTEGDGPFLRRRCGSESAPSA
ncbi:hypothetical protein F4677DRAFT_162804 [Hypoxylon crocopeplum]|nr:hypothetical protein F4677DRAFT_162804 [Hypoxylon crocopeplum]